MTPTRRLTTASTISAVTATFGTVLRIRSMRVKNSGGRSGLLSLEAFDLVPQSAVLRLVGWPDLLLCHLAEFLDLGFDHGHAERLEQGLGLLEMIDRLGQLTNLFLRGARKIEHQFLLIRREPVPDLAVH